MLFMYFTKLEILSHHLFSKITIHLWGRGNPILISWSQDTMLFFNKKFRPVHRRLWNKNLKAFWKGKYQVWFLSFYSIIIFWKLKITQLEVVTFPLPRGFLWANGKSISKSYPQISAFCSVAFSPVAIWLVSTEY